jgi:hypothetical protein
LKPLYFEATEVTNLECATCVGPKPPKQFWATAQLHRPEHQQQTKIMTFSVAEITKSRDQE